jgi:hypothetical protein
MRDGSYFSFPMALANGINGALWTVYGLVIEDWLMAAPSLVAVISSIIQVCKLNTHTSSESYLRIVKYLQVILNSRKYTNWRV